MGDTSYSLSLKNKCILNFYQTIASGLADLNAYSTWPSPTLCDVFSLTTPIPFGLGWLGKDPLSLGRLTTLEVKVQDQEWFII